MFRSSPTNAHIVDVLSVNPGEQDTSILKRIFSKTDWTLCPGSEWRLTTLPNAERALYHLREHATPIVIYGCDRNPYGWQRMVREVTDFSDPPLLILTSRLADEYLWAEALNLGAHDVLAQPFDEGEVTRVMSLAWLRWAAREEPTRATGQRAFRSVA